MAKIQLTKNELKKQKDGLKRFLRYLPTLILKKQHLQMEIRRVDQEIRQINEKLEALTRSLSKWIAVFAEGSQITKILSIVSLERGTGNIAGIDIPIYRALNFAEQEYDLFDTPPWIDSALETLKELLTLEAQQKVLDEQVRLLAEELRITTQRVNLFEKVKIPEAREGIRRIQIYLGDQQTAAVVRGKIAKNKIVRVGV